MKQYLQTISTSSLHRHFKSNRCPLVILDCTMSHSTIVEVFCCSILIILLLLGYVVVKDNPYHLKIYNYFAIGFFASCFFIAYYSSRSIQDLNHGMGPDTVSGYHQTSDLIQKEMVSITMPPPPYDQLDMCGQCPQLLWDEPPNYEELFGTSQSGCYIAFDNLKE